MDFVLLIGSKTCTRCVHSSNGTLRLEQRISRIYISVLCDREKKVGKIKKIPIILYYDLTKSVILYWILLHIFRFCCLCPCFVCEPIESAQWYRPYVQGHRNFKVIHHKTFNRDTKCYALINCIVYKDFSVRFHSVFCRFYVHTCSRV